MSERLDHEAPVSREDYRTMVERLVATCLARIRHYELPDAAEPLAAEWPPRD